MASEKRLETPLHKTVQIDQTTAEAVGSAPDEDDKGATKHTIDQEMLVGNLRSFFERPLLDLKALSREAFSISDFWQDMTRREGTHYHQGTLVCGILIALVTVVYCILVKLEKAEENETFRDYVIIEMCIVAAAQLFYSGNGICVENAPMLLAANVNAVALAVRLAVKKMLFDVPNWTLVAVFALIACAHLICSALAFKAQDGFHRFITFTMGNELHIQRMYRHYEWWKAAAVMDIQASVMATATIVFFMSTELWHYVIYAVLFGLSILLRSTLRYVIRTEKIKSSTFCIVVVPLYLLFPAFLSLSYWWTDFVHVDVQSQSQAIALFTLICFFLMRVLLLAATYRCVFHFGLGMKRAFAKERSIAEFFVSWRIGGQGHEGDGQHQTAEIIIGGERYFIPVFVNKDPMSSPYLPPPVDKDFVVAKKPHQHREGDADQAHKEASITKKGEESSVNFAAAGTSSVDYGSTTVEEEKPPAVPKQEQEAPAAAANAEGEDKANKKNRSRHNSTHHHHRSRGHSKHGHDDDGTKNDEKGTTDEDHDDDEKKEKGKKKKSSAVPENEHLLDDDLESPLVRKQ